MKKKIVSLILAMSLAFTFTGAVFAQQVENAGTTLYVETEPCPEDAFTYAKKNIYRFLYSCYEETGEDISNYKLGSPFLVKNEDTNIEQFYFPIFENYKIIYTFRVYDTEQGYEGILSKVLVDKLNDLKGFTSKSNPAKLMIDNNNLICILNGEIEVVLQSTDGSKALIDTISVSNCNANSVINSLNAIDYVTWEIASTRAPSSYYISMGTPVETQGSENWCAAFVAAAIIRYKASLPYLRARHIADHYNKSTSASLSTSEIIQFAKLKGLQPVLRENTSNITVKNDIAKNNPVYMGFYKYSDPNAAHALMAKGYSDSVGVFEVWNPWYNYYERMSMGTGQYNDGSNTAWIWYRYIYNWQ